MATIGFLGTGHMSGAILAGMFSDEKSPFHPNDLQATCKTPEHAEKIAQTYGIKAHCDNQKLVADSDFLILGVKPTQMKEVLEEIASCNLTDKIIITIAAGLRVEHYRKMLGENAVIVRAMPNIAAAQQAALTGIFTDNDLSTEEEEVIDQLFSAIGETAWLDDETQIDGITALSGSGIAYFFRLMQAMLTAGERYGFERDELYDIITLTAVGAGTLALENEATPPEFADFCRQIAVTGGTTEQALNLFNQRGIDEIVDDAMNAVVNRSREIAEEITQNW